MQERRGKKRQEKQSRVADKTYKISHTRPPCVDLCAQGGLLVCIYLATYPSERAARRKKTRQGWKCPHSNGHRIGVNARVGGKIACVELMLVWCFVSQKSIIYTLRFSFFMGLTFYLILLQKNRCSKIAIKIYFQLQKNWLRCSLYKKLVFIISVLK